jgi:polyhydroxyalkanoate synthesis regulator phasin
MQTQGERVVARMRRDAERFMTRSRGELLKEVRQIERRVLKTFHAATQEQVNRLEGRIAKLERTVAGLRGSTGERAA